jgi:hypothetical protein
MPENRSTTVQGNDFRDNVKRLLDLTPGCGNVQTECPIGSQPVDLSHLVTAAVLERIARDYEADGRLNDEEAEQRTWS